MFDQNELLELFETDSKIIGDESAGMIEYEKLDDYGFKLKLCIFSYDEFCSISLWYKNFANPIFDIGFDKVSKILCRKNKLIIQQENNEKDAVVYFKPTYTFVFEDHLEQ